MKSFIKILQVVLVALVANVYATSTTIAFSSIPEKVASFSFHKEILKTTLKVVENYFSNCCQNK